jgi:hypothetical protein
MGDSHEEDVEDSADPRNLRRHGNQQLRLRTYLKITAAGGEIDKRIAI